MRHKLQRTAVWLQEHFIAIELITCGVAIVALIMSGLQYYSLSQEYALAKQQLASSSATYKKITDTWRERFAIVTGRNTELSGQLSAEQQKNSEFASQLTGVKGQVDQLAILAKIDKELLQKYSKVYFLSENYEPATTTLIASKYLYEPDAEQRFQAQAYPFLTRMIDAASTTNVSLKIISGYRSFGYQSTLKTDYKTSFGSGANAFSADQGYSEHQLGTTVDLTTPKIGANFSNVTKGFESSEAFKWMSENAHKYGFILSYPKGNSYYISEPWHWRFVGVALATRLYDEKKNFHDLEQRVIDPYLLLIFN